MGFEDKVTIITGGGSGIGGELCIGFANEGSKVVVVDIDFDTASEVSNQINEKGQKSFPLKIDVPKGSETKKMVEATVKEYGRVDVLVNCAGVMRRNSLFDIPEEEWDWVMAVNVKGVFLSSQAVAAQMVKNGTKGKIINIASIGGFVALPNLMYYQASKGAVVMITRASAMELAPHGINVNAVAPGPIRTPMIRDRFENPEMLRWLLDRIPLSRVGEQISYL